MKIKAPQISFFQACILAFLAIITACAVFAACSIVAIPKKIDAVEKNLAEIQKAQEREAAALEEHNREWQRRERRRQGLFR